MKLILRLSLFSACIISGVCNSLDAQTVTVKVDPNTQRFIGNVSTLDRSKYFKMHNGTEDTEFNQLNSDYGVTVGRGFWGPYSYAKSQTGVVGTYPSFKTGNTDLRDVREGYIATEHPYNVARYSLNATTMAEWAVEYYKDFVDQSGRGEYFEPMNEPFVHAGDDDFSAEQPDDQLMRVKMAEIYAAIGEEFDRSPELANMKVIGYSSAWPSVELWDFGHWDTRMKMFMDVAGEHMDAFSTHLYDGINVTGQDTRRSGSNSEAILDLIETYSYAKWGTIKPHAISEYGGIESGYDDSYSDIKSIQSIKSINHLLFNLLEREDRLLISIPFITGKAEWHITEANNYEPYGAVLWRPLTVTPTADPNNPILDDWTYTARIHFFQLWQNVSGDRVQIKSSNPDIQTHAFVDGNKLYVALNNLDDVSQVIDLDLDLEGLQEVNSRSLKIYANEDPIYSDVTQSSPPELIALIAGETTILEYTFENPISFDNSVASTNYYSSQHLYPIVADEILSYSFDNVAIGFGDAILRMSIGRKHDKSKSPEIHVNGNLIPVPENWKGYDQSNRDDFFGMLEIPVSMDYLQSTNNVTVKFPDSDGHVSSLILTVNKCVSDCNLVVAPSECLENTYASGGWENTLEDGQHLIIEDDISLSGNIMTCQLEVSGGKTLTVMPGSTLELQGSISFETLIPNIYEVGNMDSGEPGYIEWGSWNGATNNPREFTMEAARSGTYGLHVDFPDDGSSQWTLSTSADAQFSLISGNEYEVSFWAKTVSNSSNSIDFRVVANGWTSTISSGQYTLTNEWSKFTVTVTATETKNHFVWLGFHQNKSALEDGSNAETFYIDDIEVLDPSIPSSPGKLIISSGASLVTHDIYSNDKSVTIKRNTRYSNGRYSFVGTPVEGSSEITGSDLGSHVYWYDETTVFGEDGINRWKDASATELLPGVGYAQASQKEITFTGIPNDGSITVSGLSHTNLDDNHDEHGWSLLSNPYPAAIDVELFLQENTATSGAVYLWDDHGSNTSRGSNSDYLVVNSLGDIGSGPNGGSFNGHIGSMQGFFVKIAAPSSDASVTFTEAMRVSGNNGDAHFFRKANETPLNIKLAIESESPGFYNELLVGLRKDATIGTDRIYDADKLTSSDQFQFYSLINDAKYAIQGLPIEDGVSTELAFDLSIESSLKLSLIELTGLEDGMTFFLLDKETGKTYDLSIVESFDFEAAKGSDQNRFLLTYGSSNILSTADKPDQPVYRYSDNELSVSFGKEVEVKGFVVYDLSGKILSKNQHPFDPSNMLSIPIEHRGINIVKIVSSEGTFTRKFLF
ncbi:MAG: carbohydrate binding domain-containing protein [Cyclobacteriaceae bacterium]